MARRGRHVSANAGNPDQSFVPTETGFHEQLVLSGLILQHLAQFGPEPVCTNTHFFIEQVLERNAAQGGHSER